MANRTDPAAATVHGGNPQNLIEKILRQRIYGCVYWKEHCFGLTAETLVDKAIELEYYGGAHGGLRKPTPFLCLILKMLQIQPEREIVLELIQNDEYKYVRALGAFYLRLIANAKDIYTALEPLYNDCRKIRFRQSDSSYVIKHMDEFIEEILSTDFVCDVTLPFLLGRPALENTGQLQPRMSALEGELEGLEAELREQEAAEKAAAAKLGRQKLQTAQELVEKTQEMLKNATGDELAQLQEQLSTAEAEVTKFKAGLAALEEEEQAEKEEDAVPEEEDGKMSLRAGARDEVKDTKWKYKGEKTSRSRSRDRRRRSRSRSRDRRRSRSRSRDRRRGRSRSVDRRRDRRRSRSRDSRRSRSRERRPRDKPSDDKKPKKEKKKKEKKEKKLTEEEIEIQEAQRLRASLGIKPLRV